jgi:hypothetical protein
MSSSADMSFSGTVDGVLVIIVVAVFNGHGWLLVFVGFDFKFLVKERKMGKPSPHITVHH